MKRLIKWILITAVFVLTTHIGLQFYFGRIDYKETLRTEYHPIDSVQIIETNHFKIMTPKNWIHIFQGYGAELDAAGCFITGNGRIHYEYGMFSNEFTFDSIFVFQQDSLTLNRFTIFIGKNESNEYGIHIPRQHEMQFPFSFYMSEACRVNFTELSNSIRNLEFKKAYIFDSKEVQN
ncbi:hypothetical protein EYV94_27415 [Puteibacter caeruleilacunae]|nr:hypothetical protein EYV94_27415 [Puteibacter caeruleilacunae]